MSPLDQYLDRVARQLRDYPASVNDNELRELRIHLEQLIEDGMTEGKNRDTATQDALAQFGEARSIGIRLRDACDEREIGWTQVVAAACGGIGFWLSASILFLYTAIESEVWAASGLFPELPYALFAFLGIIPLITGVIFSACLGRRAWIFGFAFQGFLSSLIHSLPIPAINENAIQTFCWNMVWCGLGIGISNHIFARRRRSQFVYADVGKSAAISRFAPYLPKRTKVTLRQFCARLALLGFIPLYAKLRFNSVVCAKTPVRAVQVDLLMGVESDRFKAPKITALQELPLDSHLNDLDGRRRVRFEAVVSAKDFYRRDRIQFLQKQILISRRDNGHPEKDLQASLSRVRANAFKVQGTATVLWLGGAWYVDQSSFDSSRLRGWCEDIYFRE